MKSIDDSACTMPIFVQLDVR